ncbi:MAG: hypothetical protein WA208_20710 [Thermoanaerobaculia bacterium]
MIEAEQHRVRFPSAAISEGIQLWRETKRMPARVGDAVTALQEAVMRVIVAGAAHMQQDVMREALQVQQAALDTFGVAVGLRRPRSGGPRSVRDVDRALHVEWVAEIIAAGGDFGSSSTRSKANRVLENRHGLKPETLRKKLQKGREACDAKSCRDPKHPLS